jgi:hypothetical protein
MPGGVLQLAANGTQNIFLTGNPQITFFVSVYKRHTNFAIESIREYLTGTADFGKRLSCVIDRYGDLINEVFLEVDLPRISYPFNESHNIFYSWTNSIGHALIKYVEIEIGGEIIDRHYGQWLEIWNELTIPEEKRMAYNEMIGKHKNFNATTQGGPMKLRIPLQFWFCKNKGLALPLIALQFHEVRFNFEFRKLDELWTSSTGKIVNDVEDCINQYDPNPENDPKKCCIPKCNFDECPPKEQECCNIKNLKIENAILYIDYIFLDTEERRRFAQCQHEYLIEQLQIHTESLDTNVGTNKITLEFNHPVKELIWIFQTEDVLQQRRHTGLELFNFNAGISNNPIASDDCNNFSDYKENKCNKPNNPCIICNDDSCIDCCIDKKPSILIPSDPMVEAIIQFEGNDRFKEREGKYFRLIQPYQRHSRVPDNFIYLYSFGFTPEEHQPSGTANFSMLDHVELQFKMKSGIKTAVMVSIYAPNYNILKIQNGMAGVVYNN